MDYSKLVSLYDFKLVTVSPKLLRIEIKVSELLKRVDEIREHFLEIQEVQDEVKNGDFLVVETQKEDTKEPEFIQVNVGKHFYNAKWEDEVIGMKPNTEVTLPKRDGNRTGIIRQIKRRIFPEMSDELVERLQIEGIHTVKDYEMYIQEQMVRMEKNKKENAIFKLVSKETISKSEFKDLKEETEEQYRDQVEFCKETAEEQNKTYEEIIAGFMPQKLKTLEEREAYLWGECEENVKCIMIGHRILEDAGQSLNQESYEEAVQQYLAMGMTKEDIEARFDYEIYIAQTLRQVFAQQILDFYKEKYEVVRV